MALVLTITAAGRAALVNAQNTGTAPVTIARVGVSPQALAPTAATAALPAEIKRIATLSGDVVADDTIHLIVRDESSDIYTIRSFALYLGDGTLFAAYGQADPIMEKSAQSLLLLAIDVRFLDIAAPDLTFGDATFINPPATVDRQGVVELATDAEAADGTDPVRAVTPRGAKAAVTAWLNSRFGDGAPSAFMKGLLLSASAAAFRASLAIKSAALKDEGAGNGLDADLLDGQHGAWYADIPARLGYTPWHLNNDGAGSGLDADLLDGKEGAAYALLAAAGNTFTGNITVGGTLAVGGAATFTARSSHEGGLTARGGSGIQLNNAANNVGFSINNDGTNLTFSAPLAVTGAVSAAGLVATGAAPAWTGAGAAAFINGGNAWLSAYNYATAAQLPLYLSGLSVRQRVGNADITVASSTGLAVTGDLSVTGIVSPAEIRATGMIRAAGWYGSGYGPVDGLAVEIGQSGGVGAIYAVKRSDATYGPLEMRSNGFTVKNQGGANIAVFGPTSGLAITGEVSSTGDMRISKSGGWLYGRSTAGTASRIIGIDSDVYVGSVDAAIGNLYLVNSGVRATFSATGCALPGTLAVTGAITRSGSTVWDAGNDGSGSGLDADLLDGQHGSYYLPAASYTAADVLAKLKTVDGAGTGVDADLLDGQHGDFWRDWINLLNKPASFPPSAHFHLAADLAGAFTGSMTQNGWLVLPNGLIIQWGRFGANPNTTTRVSFPIVFPSACFAVSPNGGANGGADSKDNPPVLLGHTVDQVGFTLFTADDASGAGGFIAIGY